MEGSLQRIISELPPGELVAILRREYLRRLTKYKLIDEKMRRKYERTFEEFERENMVAQRGYSWEVESDAQEWEQAVDGIATCKRKLEELEVGH